MPTLPRGGPFTENEWVYLLWHCGWRPPLIWVRCGIDKAESQLDSSAYRPRKENNVGGPADVGPFPQCKCIGYDIGGEMYNERINGQATALHDALALFDWREAMKLSLGFAQANPSAPFGPWAYPKPSPGRNDTTLDIAGIASRVGPNPYAIERSPYWKMKATGVPVHDLPVPPRELWVSPLPAAPLSQGQSGTQTSPLGIAINTFQRRLHFEDCWITKTGASAGAFNWYYGSDWVKSSLVKHQTRMASFGLWDGPIDGSKFTVEYREVWDSVLHYNHMIGGD